MAQAVEFPINIFIKDNKIFAQIENLDARISMVTESVTTASKTFKSAFSAVNLNSVIDLVGKISKGFESLVGGALDFEKTQANMTTLFKGNKDAADAMLGSIRDYAKATSYDTSGLAKAQQTMMSFGLDADFAFGKLKNIGDIAMGDKEKMQSLALAFAQTTSTGKLMGQDLLQMINQGFNPLAVISEKTGISIDVLKDKMGKGAISAQMVAQAFEWATEEGSQFYNGAINSGDTVAGKIDKIRENIDNMKISLFNATGGATAYIAEVGAQVGDLANLIPVITGVANGVKWLTSLTWLQTAATKAWTGVQWLLNAAFVASPIGWIVAGIGALVAVITVCWNKFAGFRAVIMTVWDTIKGFGGVIKAFVIDRIKGLIEGLGAVGEMFKKLFSGDFKGAFESGKTAVVKITGIDAVKNAVENTKNVVGGIGANYTRHYAEESAKQEAKERKKKDDKVAYPELGVFSNAKTGGGKTGGGILENAGSTAGSSAGQVKAVNIHIANMIGTWNAAAGYNESRADMEDKLAESLARILGMAETAA
jgi:tape measure domain-containing protein